MTTNRARKQETSVPRAAPRTAARRRRTFDAEKRDATTRRAPRRKLNASHALAAVLLVAAAGLLAWFQIDMRFIVREAVVEGATQYSAAEVYQASGLNGVNVFHVDPAAVEVAIGKAIPGIGNVRVRCEWPNRVVVDVDERSATFVWHDGQAAYLVDGTGYVFAADDGSHSDLLVFQAEESQPCKVGDRLDVAILDAGRELNRLIPVVKTFTISPLRGISIRNADGVRIDFGRDDLAKKVAAMNAVLQRTMASGQSIECIDVRFPASVYYK